MTLTDKWQALDTEPIPGGTVGGDGAGEAWSVRWGKRNQDGTYAFITTNYYSVDASMRGYGNPDGSDVAEEQAKRFDVENQTEFLICTDPEDLGGTEVWSDYEYQDDCNIVYLGEDEADKLAKRLAARELANFDMFYSWTGEPKSRG